MGKGYGIERGAIWEQVREYIGLRVHAGRPHWLSRISVQISVLYDFWAMLMAGAQTVGQSVINELFFAFTDWMHSVVV